jgi:hypothetical protein
MRSVLFNLVSVDHEITGRNPKLGGRTYVRPPNFGNSFDFREVLSIISFLQDRHTCYAQARQINQQWDGIAINMSVVFDVVTVCFAFYVVFWTCPFYPSILQLEFPKVGIKYISVVVKEIHEMLVDV